MLCPALWLVDHKDTCNPIMRRHELLFTPAVIMKRYYNFTIKIHQQSCIDISKAYSINRVCWKVRLNELLLLPALVQSGSKATRVASRCKQLFVIQVWDAATPACSSHYENGRKGGSKFLWPGTADGMVLFRNGWWGGIVVGVWFWCDMTLNQLSWQVTCGQCVGISLTESGVL